MSKPHRVRREYKERVPKKVGKFMVQLAKSYREYVDNRTPEQIARSVRRLEIALGKIDIPKMFREIEREMYEKSERQKKYRPKTFPNELYYRFHYDNNPSGLSAIL